jgi:hypothetical protein
MLHDHTSRSGWKAARAGDAGAHHDFVARLLTIESRIRTTPRLRA